MTFEEYIKECGEELFPWQREAANKFLVEVHKVSNVPAAGKSWLAERLVEFLAEFGSSFEVVGRKVLTYRPLYHEKTITSGVVSEERLDEYQVLYVLENGHETIVDSRFPYSGASVSETALAK